MTPDYVGSRPHLHKLAARMQSLLELADEMYRLGQSSGESVEYAEFEKAIGERAAAVEREVHAVALSGLDVSAPLIRAWGKHYRRVHRQTRSYATLAGPVDVTRLVSSLEVGASIPKLVRQLFVASPPGSGHNFQGILRLGRDGR